MKKINVDGIRTHEPKEYMFDALSTRPRGSMATEGNIQLIRTDDTNQLLWVGIRFLALFCDFSLEGGAHATKDIRDQAIASLKEAITKKEVSSWCPPSKGGTFSLWDLS